MTRTVYAPSVPTRYDPISKTRVTSIDVRPAQEFGEVRVLLPRDFHIDQDNIDEACELIAEGLADVRKGDLILAVGDPIAIAAAVAYSTDATGSAVVLRWNRLIKKYEKIEVQL